MRKALDSCLCLNDFERHARRLLPEPIFGYISAAAEDRAAFDNNVNAFKSCAFIHRVLVDVSHRDCGIALFDQEYAQPFGIAPVGLSALFTYRGDLALSNAASSRRIPMIMSGSSLIPLEEVAQRNPQAWFQAYLPGDADQIDALMRRVIRAGFKTLVITVDTPVHPNKEHYIRSGFSTPLRFTPRLFWQGVSHPRWLAGTFLKTVAKHGIPHFENNYASRGAPIVSRHIERDFSDRGHLNWEHVKLIRRLWKHPLVIKGILSPQDASMAAELGADGIILSNHGGRQLDGAVSPFEMLPLVVERCPRTPIMLDGGIRRGSDVLKCLALGARCVFVGRPFAYAAGVAGQRGIEKAIDLLSAEIDRNMAMLGLTRLGDLRADGQRFLRGPDATRALRAA
ncbi:alpha-hydroxy-acid oxidizing protein [Candidimonas humi]|uniref:Alpha-hydroxy-acid oxidizing protein n=1 Tax=Candidimonas humi TaxID=683355 RepID=A0ABV8P0M1_9BURK|nr:alpha-hydroxy acid oxidase [Candidimonas humi]MBV6304238.1 alpha-hydroxy-acid oxidizing protein [Candidimonas humi]